VPGNGDGVVQGTGCWQGEIGRYVGQPFQDQGIVFGSQFGNNVVGVFCVSIVELFERFGDVHLVADVIGRQPFTPQLEVV